VWITGTAADLGLDATALADLEAADLVRTADGRVTVAYPFSGTPTRQRVELDGFPGVYAMCAIDALGLPVMAGRDGQITATDPHDDAPVRVSVQGGTWTWTPPGAVVVDGEILGQQPAIDLGRRIFGPLLRASATQTARPGRLPASRSSTAHSPDNSTTFA